MEIYTFNRMGRRKVTGKAQDRVVPYLGNGEVHRRVLHFFTHDTLHLTVGLTVYTILDSHGSDRVAGAEPLLADRQISGHSHRSRDPRPSLAERYADDAAYVQAVRVEAERQVAERLLLPADARRAVERAAQGRLDRLTK